MRRITRRCTCCRIRPRHCGTTDREASAPIRWTPTSSFGEYSRRRRSSRTPHRHFIGRYVGPRSRQHRSRTGRNFAGSASSVLGTRPAKAAEANRGEHFSDGDLDPTRRSTTKSGTHKAAQLLTCLRRSVLYWTGTPRSSRVDWAPCSHKCAPRGHDIRGTPQTACSQQQT
jgi:hypothetical protein